MHKPTERVLDILLLISKEKEALNLSQISEITNIPKSTLFPILATLNKKKFIYKNEDNTYKMGINSYLVGSSYIGKHTILGMIEKYMIKIVEECNEICQLGILRNNMVFYIAKKEPEQAIKLVSSVGKLLPVYSTALGKMLMSQYSAREIKEYIGENYTALTKYTKTNIKDFLKDLNNARKNNFAIDIKETSEEIECIAVAIEKEKKILAAISISVPVYRSSEEKFIKLKDLLFKYKKIIEYKLESDKFKDDDLNYFNS